MVAISSMSLSINCDGSKTSPEKEGAFAFLGALRYGAPGKNYDQHVHGRIVMAEKVEDLTVNYEEDGVLVVKEIDKEILSKGSWTTILFRYQDLDRAKGEFGPDKFTIRRYQKRNGQYQTKSKFNISSAAQAQKIIETLARWTNQDGE